MSTDTVTHNIIGSFYQHDRQLTAYAFIIRRSIQQFFYKDKFEKYRNRTFTTTCMMLIWQNNCHSCKKNFYSRSYFFWGNNRLEPHGLVHQDKVNYPDKAATTREESIPTDPSPTPIFFCCSAAASALFLNI